MAVAFSADNLAYIFSCALILVYAWSVYVPLIPDEIRFNSEWLWPLSIAAQKHLAYGRDIMFTYGPLGYAAGGYFPSTFPLVIAFYSILALAVWSSLYLILQQLAAPRVVRIAVLAVFFMLAAGEHASMLDARILFLPILLLAYQFASDRPRTAVKVILGVALALAGLVKFTYLVIGGVVCGAIGIDELLRTRKPITAFIFAAIYLIGWRLTGQAFSNFPGYIASSLDIASGYSEAMTLWGNDELRSCLSFIVPAVLIVALAGMLAGRSRGRRIGFALTLLLVFWMIFKSGYARHDSHDIMATSALPPCVIACALITFASPFRRTWIAGWTIALLLSIYAASHAYATAVDINIATRTWRSFGSTVAECGDAAHILAGGRSNISGKYATLQKTMAAALPLPDVKGTTDALTFWPTPLMANGLDYFPRPSILSYAAFTPKLAQANARFYHDPAGPQNIFYGPGVIDHRMVAQEDGPAMLEMLSQFDLVGSAGEFLEYRRSATPRTISLTPLQEIEARFAEPVEIPYVPGKLIWAVIDVKPTLRGRIMSVLYRSPSLWFTLALRDGRVLQVERFIPGCGRAGFIISPAIHFAASVADLSTPRIAAPEGTIYSQGFAISSNEGGIPQSSYGQTYDVKFYAVEFLKPSP